MEGKLLYFGIEIKLPYSFLRVYSQKPTHCDKIGKEKKGFKAWNDRRKGEQNRK